MIKLILFFFLIVTLSSCQRPGREPASLPYGLAKFVDGNVTCYVAQTGPGTTTAVSCVRND